MPGQLNHSPSRIIKQFFIDEGLGSDPDTDLGGEWPVYRGREPDRPDSLIRVHDTEGTAEGYTQGDSERQERHGVQVLVRSVNDDIGYLKARTLALALDGITRYHLTVDADGTGTADAGARYQITSVTRTSDVIPLGSDTPQGKRLLFTVNALVSVRQCF